MSRGQVQRVGRLAKTISGSGFPEEYQGRDTGDFPFLKVSDLRRIDNANGILKAANYVLRKDVQALGARIVPAGSVIFPKIGAALLGNTRALTLTACLLDNNLMAVVPSHGDRRYWKYALTTVDLAEFAGSGPLPYVSDSQIRDLRLPFPPPDQQRRIADFLDAETAQIDRVASTQRQARTILLERRAARVFDAVTGRDKAGHRLPSTLAWAESLPHPWQGVKLGHYARIGSGHTPSRSRPEWWKDCTIPWITTGEVSKVRDDRCEIVTETRECISELGLINSAAELHPEGTVVLCRTASAGYSAVMGQQMATSQDFVTWTCGPHLDPFYLLWCLRTMRSDLLGRLAMGSTHKTIYVPDLQMLRIPLPPLCEQRSIVESIRAANSAIDAAVDVIDRQLALLAERRQALITAAVTGKLDVTTARLPMPGGASA